MARNRPHITDTLIEESVNGALGEIVNKLRLTALEQKQEIRQKIQLTEIFSLAEERIAGQFGHDGAGHLSPVQVDRKRLRAALETLASPWSITLDGDEAIFTVAVPKRQVLPIRHRR